MKTQNNSLHLTARDANLINYFPIKNTGLFMNSFLPPMASELKRYYISTRPHKSHTIFHQGDLRDYAVISLPAIATQFSLTTESIILMP